jgi:hypothetical protein
MRLTMGNYALKQSAKEHSKRKYSKQQQKGDQWPTKID